MVEGPQDARLLKAIVDETDDAFITIDEAQLIVYVNRGAERMLGYDRHELIGLPLDTLVPELSRVQHRDLVKRFIARQTKTHHMAQRTGISAVRKDGQVFPADATIVRTETEEGVCLTAILRDTTNIKALQAKAITDPLTGLLNRRGFLDAANAELRRSERYRHDLAFMMMDLDFFKDINDRFGHAAGDRVLESVAQCCRETLRGHDLIGRVGGEEFAAVLVSANIADAWQAAERLRQAVEALRIDVSGRQILVRISIGLALNRAEELDCNRALHSADRALYAAKLAGRNCVRAVDADMPCRPAAVLA